MYPVTRLKIVAPHGSKMLHEFGSPGVPQLTGIESPSMVQLMVTLSPRVGRRDSKSVGRRIAAVAQRSDGPLPERPSDCRGDTWRARSIRSDAALQRSCIHSGPSSALERVRPVRPRCTIPWPRARSLLVRGRQMPDLQRGRSQQNGSGDAECTGKERGSVGV